MFALSRNRAMNAPPFDSKDVLPSAEMDVQNVPQLDVHTDGPASATERPIAATAEQETEDTHGKAWMVGFW